MSINPILQATAHELVAQVTESLGDLPAEYRTKAEELAKGAQLLGVEVVTGVLPLDRARKAAKDLALAAESIISQSGLDVLGRRKALLTGGMQVLLKLAITLAGA